MGTLRRTNWILVTALLVVGLFIVVEPAAAAPCSRNQAGVYVCDSRPRLPTFATPTYADNSLFFDVTYAWLEDHVPLYESPGGPVAEEGTEGILYYTIEETAADAEGNRWYRVDDRWANASTMHLYGESKFSGVELLREPERPFGWVVQRFRPAPAPDAEPAADVPWVTRYTFIEVYDVARGEEGWVWFDVGDDQWVRQTHLSVVDVSPRPREIAKDEFWVEVDLYEQIFAAYEGDRMVYAGLVSSGLDRWPTNEGLFNVYARHREWPMWGGDVGEDYYYLQDVPYTMFFDGDIALHGAYWHDRFGYQRSHGCVNMPPRDAEWVWHWSEEAPNDLRVWVHSSEPDHFLQRYEGLLTPGAAR